MFFVNYFWLRSLQTKQKPFSRSILCWCWLKHNWKTLGSIPYPHVHMLKCPWTWHLTLACFWRLCCMCVNGISWYWWAAASAISVHDCGLNGWLWLDVKALWVVRRLKKAWPCVIYKDTPGLALCFNSPCTTYNVF